MVSYEECEAFLISRYGRDPQAAQASLEAAASPSACQPEEDGSTLQFAVEVQQGAAMSTKNLSVDAEQVAPGEDPPLWSS